MIYLHAYLLKELVKFGENYYTYLGENVVLNAVSKYSLIRGT